MGTRQTRDIRRALLSKGFQQSLSHHEMYWLYAGDKRTSIRTRISLGAREYDDGLLGLVARQLKLNRRSLDSLIECPMSGQAYLERMQREGHVRASG